MLNGDRIKKLIVQKGITKVVLRKYINVSPPTLDDVIKGKTSGSIATVEKIADYFKLPIDYFFDREVEIVADEDSKIGHRISGNGNSVSGDITLAECTRELEYLRDLIAEKDRIITEKERTIQILLDRK